MLYPDPNLDALIAVALAEDLRTGDVTSEALIPADATGRARIEARHRLVLCGQPLVQRLLERWGPGVEVSWCAEEGAWVEGVVGHLEGRMRDILAVERTLLNFMQRMSGVATHTRAFVEAIEGTGARMVDTRKTLPGHRVLDKYATRVGGATNHRAALDAGILIKDNHIAAVGGVGEAVRRARAAAPHCLRIEVEVEDLPGLDEALEAGAEVILIDNFTPAEAAAAVQRVAGRAMVEASGGITLETARAYAEAGVDLLAVGALTHSAPAVDLALEHDG